MIFYVVKARFFTKKNEAETYRRAEGLRPKDTHKIDLRSRDDMVDFLNGMLSYVQPEKPTKAHTQGEAIKPYVTDIEAAPDFIPEFVKNDWRQRNKYA